jgi:hypothetical protein
MIKRNAVKGHYPSPIMDFLKTIYFLFTPEIIFDYLSSWPLYLFAFCIDALLLAGFIWLTVQTVENLHNAKYISLEQTSSCTAVTKSVTGTYYISISGDANVQLYSQWNSRLDFFSAIKVTLNDFEQTEQQYQAIMTTVYDEFFADRQLGSNTLYDYAVLFALAGVFSYYDSSDSEIARFEGTGDPIYYFKNCKFNGQSGHILPDNTFYQFQTGYTSYDSDYGKIFFSPASNDPYTYAYISDLSYQGYSAIDITYTLTVLAFNRDLHKGHPYTNFLYYVGDTGVDYTYNGLTYTAYTRKDPNYPLGDFLCVDYPRTFCILRNYFLSNGDEEFAIPILTSDTEIQYVSGRLFLGLVYFNSFQDAINAMLLYSSNNDFNTYVVAFVYASSGSGYYYDYTISNCGDCTRVLILDITGRYYSNNAGTSMYAYQLLNYQWLKYFAKKTPTDLVENYYECQLSVSSAFVQGIGITSGNVQLAYSLLMLAIVPLTLFLVRLKATHHQHLTEKGKRHELMEKYSDLMLRALAKDLPRDELTEPISLERMIDLMDVEDILEFHYSSKKVVVPMNIRPQVKTMEIT